jgi:sulfate adenylyltransferase
VRAELVIDTSRTPLEESVARIRAALDEQTAPVA